MYVVLSKMGELYIYSKKSDPKYKMMHQLRGVYIQKQESFKIKFG